LQSEFTTKLHERLGSSMTTDELAQLDLEVLTPEYEHYADDDEGSYTCIDEEHKVTLDYNDMCVGAEVLLPIEGTMKTGCVVPHAHNGNGKLTRHHHSNPILL